MPRGACAGARAAHSVRCRVWFAFVELGAYAVYQASWYEYSRRPPQGTARPDEGIFIRTRLDENPNRHAVRRDSHSAPGVCRTGQPTDNQLPRTDQEPYSDSMYTVALMFFRPRSGHPCVLRTQPHLGRSARATRHHVRHDLDAPYPFPRAAASLHSEYRAAASGCRCRFIV